jgi:predicted AlkP superfamily pyrophosphatase or phosphodiesterase
MTRPARRTFLSVVAAALVALGCAAATGQAASPIAILISFDGWRWDYLDRYEAPALRALAARGVRAEGLIPAFPTSTFPNHYTLVTGLHPDRHGIVSNTIVDRTIGPERFTMSSDTAKDPRWWGGEPIWATAMRQGHRSASMFWPGSEAIRPTHWRPYDTTVPIGARVDQVLAWLALPDAERPSFITLYFSDVDTAGHRGGPNSADVAAAVARVDGALAALDAGLVRLGLVDRTTIVVVSDHGMIETSTDRRIFLSDYVEAGDVDVVDSGALLAINPTSHTTVDAVHRTLSDRHQALTVYRREALPAALRYGAHSRVPAIVGLVEPGWLVAATRPAGPAPSPPRIGGAHGYAPWHRDMQGLFVAAGPRLRRGLAVGPFDSVHVYHVLCAVLNLTPARNDGTDDVAKRIVQ